MKASQQTRDPGGILQELLRTPVFKDILRSALTSVRHADGRTAVRTVTGQDPEVFLSLAAATPAALNILIRSMAELGRQMNTRYSPEILTVFMESLVREIDAGSLHECKTVWKDLLASLWAASPGTRRALLDAILSKGPDICAQAINGLSRSINALERDRPGSINSFLSQTLAQIDRDEWSEASQRMAGALMDQKWGVLSWSWRLLKGRLHKRFREERT